MSFFQLKEIETLHDPQVLLAMAEAISYASGECTINDIPHDPDLLAINFARSRPLGEREDFLEESQFALQAAKEEIESMILEAARHNESLLDQLYPFEIAPRDGILLARKANVRNNFEGLCYLSIQLHLLYAYDHLEFGSITGGRVEKPHLDFTQPFEKLFEVIAGISVASNIEGYLVLLSESRSASTLLTNLKEVCRVSGAGEPKNQAQLNINQIAANDGGIDAVVLDKNGAELHETTLIGATIQKSALLNKMVSTVSINRFKGFLVDGDALAPYRGCFAHPMPSSPGKKGQCGLANCTYFHKDLILQYLRPLKSDTVLARNCRSAARRAARQQLGKLEKLIIRVDFNDYHISSII